MSSRLRARPAAPVFGGVRGFLPVLWPDRCFVPTLPGWRGWKDHMAPACRLRLPSHNACPQGDHPVCGGTWSRPPRVWGWDSPAGVGVSSEDELGSHQRTAVVVAPVSPSSPPSLGVQSAWPLCPVCTRSRAPQEALIALAWGGGFWVCGGTGGRDLPSRTSGLHSPGGDQPGAGAELGE